MFDRQSRILARWMLAEHRRFHSLKKIPKAQKVKILEAAKRALKLSEENKSLRVLNTTKEPTVMLFQTPSDESRVKGQQSLHLYYEKGSRAKILAWTKQELANLAKNAPRYATIILPPGEETFFRELLERAGFRVRYEILVGNTQIALSNLIKIKNPPSSLQHLNLNIRRIEKISELGAAMRLQKQVAVVSRKHSYFSHTPAQLKRDREQYKEHIVKKNGLLLGVYRKEKLVGLMIASISDGKIGGLSFFLHPSIQGKGVVKTGYLLLLRYLQKNRVKQFYGGTSRESVLGLAKIMKRKLRFALYVKMG